MLLGGSFIVDYNYSDYNEGNIDFESITEYDKEELYLLNIQHSAEIIIILSDILSYVSTIESIELIYKNMIRTPKGYLIQISQRFNHTIINVSKSSIHSN